MSRVELDRPRFKAKEKKSLIPPKTENLHGTEILYYRTDDQLDSFIEFLKDNRPTSPLFFTESTRDYYGEYGHYFVDITTKVSFVDDKGRVHQLSGSHGDMGPVLEQTDKIRSLILKRRLGETRDVIEVADNGDIYQVYKDKDRRHGAIDYVRQAHDWIYEVGKAAEVNPQEGVLQHLKEGEQTLVDYTNGKMHLVTTLDHASRYTLETVTPLLPKITLQDNGPKINWKHTLGQYLS